jgi:gluconolactonase
VERVEGLPPLDAFNDMGRTRTNVEGAVWIDGALYVSEFPLVPAPSSRLLRLATDGTVSVALADLGSNGLAVDGAGNLLATDHRQGKIVRFTFPLDAPTELATSYDGARFNSPNDLAVRSDGTVYFSDPSYQAPNPPPQRQTRVYRLPPGSSEPAVVDSSRSQPNGVTLSLDERTLYVSGSDGIFAYPVALDGSIAPGSGARLPAFSGNSDGLALDCAGNLYATAGKRVVILSPRGDEIGSLPVTQAENVTNLAFGGPARTTLFITSMGRGNQRGVFKAELAIPGLPY